MKTFDEANKRDTFSLQLPYLNDRGKARCIDVMFSAAHQLVEAGTHTAICAGWMNTAKKQAYFVITPIVPAATGVVFQVGQPAV